MALKMESITRFYDESGKVIAEGEASADVPGIAEIDKEGFRAAFDKLEKTVLDTTNETRRSAVSDLLQELSQKKLKQSETKA